MAEQTSYIGVTPRTATATAVDIGRGLRVTRDANGLVAVSAIGVRGDYVTATEIKASKPGQVFSMQDGGKVPAVASEAAAVGDPAYSAANGKFSKTAGGGAILCGKWWLAASGDGVLGEVELSNPA